ncbi:MAG: phage tail sheath subtilisin-like domain-containing protein, partial [Elusimicrobiaceae bacterium]|nr:phage tail sheath subtilisin-like domain-containing protein [Elusimicrobiaceae bacterium]
MALGGGVFTTQNKVMPGSYINFVSAARASATLSDRGVVALPIALNWGPEEEVFTITQAEFQKDSLKILGYDYTAAEIMPFREIFLNAVKVHVFNLNAGGAKATSNLATAKYAGTRGNALKYTISASLDDESKKDVVLYMGTSKVFSQTVASAAELEDNDFVVWKKEATLTETAGTSLTGGTNGSELTGASYQAALDKLESYNFNVLVCPTKEAEVIALFVAFTKRLRDQVGVKFQLVAYQTLADYEGVISLENAVKGDDEVALVYWTAGAAAGCAVNKS